MKIKLAQWIVTTSFQGVEETFSRSIGFGSDHPLTVILTTWEIPQNGITLDSKLTLEEVSLFHMFKNGSIFQSSGHFYFLLHY